MLYKVGLDLVLLTFILLSTIIILQKQENLRVLLLRRRLKMQPFTHSLSSRVSGTGLRL